MPAINLINTNDSNVPYAVATLFTPATGNIIFDSFGSVDIEQFNLTLSGTI